MQTPVRNWARHRPPSSRAGRCLLLRVMTADVDLPATGAGRGRRRVPGADRAAPARAAGALLPDARIVPGRRGRAAGHAAGRLAGPRRFEGRASIRTWLYRIATNRCLNARRSASRRPAKEWDIPDVEPPEPTRLGEVVWLEPYPDALLEGAIDAPLGPEARYEQTESISLAFVTALQVLPPRQRRRAHPARRARVPRQRGGRHARLDRRIGHQRPQAGARRPAAPPCRRRGEGDAGLPSRFTRRAGARGEVRPAPTSPPMSTRWSPCSPTTSSVSMPPMPFEYARPRRRGPLLRQHLRAGPDVRPRADAGQRSAGVRGLPARAPAASATGRASRPHATGDRICALTRFDNDVLPWFGLPRSLPGQQA